MIERAGHTHKFNKILALLLSVRVWLSPKYLLNRCLAYLLSSRLIINPSQFELDLDLLYPTVVFPTENYETLDKREDGRDRNKSRRKTSLWNSCWGARIVLRHVKINLDYVEELVASLRIINPTAVSIDEIELSWIWSKERKGTIFKGLVTRPELKLRGLKIRASILKGGMEDNNSDNTSHEDSSASGSDATDTNDPVDSSSCSSGGNTNAINKLTRAAGSGVDRRSKIGRVLTDFKRMVETFFWGLVEPIITVLTLEVSNIEISLQMPPLDHYEYGNNSASEKESLKRSSMSMKATSTAKNCHSCRDKCEKGSFRFKQAHRIVLNKLKGPESKIGTKKISVHKKFRRKRRMKSKVLIQDEEVVIENLESDAEISKEDASLYLNCDYVCVTPHVGNQHVSSELYNQGRNLPADRLSIGSLSIHIIGNNSRLEDDSVNNGVSGCILRPFSYSAILMHIPTATSRHKHVAFNGRFDRNIQLHGRPISTYAESISNGHNDGIFVQVTEAQITWIIQLRENLSSLFSSQTSDASSDSVARPDNGKNSISSSEMPLADSPKESSIFFFTMPISSVSIILAERIYVKTSTVRFTKNNLSTQAAIGTLNIFIGKDKTDSDGLFRAFSSRITVLLSAKVEVFLYVIDALYIPGIMGLSTPLHKVIVCFEKGKLYIKLKSACNVLLDDNEPQRQSQQKVVKNKKEHSKLDLPCPLSVSVSSITFKKADRVTAFSDLNFAAEQTHTTFDGISFTINLGKIQLDDLFQAFDIQHSGRIYSKEPINTVHDLKVALGPAFCVKGFSLDDWDGCLLPRFWSESHPLRLPFAEISALKMRICVKAGIVTNNDHILKIGRFCGNHKTTMIDVKNHYVQKALTNVPGFLTGVNIFGRNVSDQTIESASMLILGPFGGIIVSSSIDTTTALIKRGKQRRGVSASDQHKPGDFFRGLKTAKEQILEGELDLKGETLQYVRKNKPQLAGCVTFCVVTPFGGPGAGILAAIVVSNLTRWYLEKREKDKFENSLDEYWKSQGN